MWNCQAILDSYVQGYFLEIKKRDCHLKKSKFFAGYREKTFAKDITDAIFTVKVCNHGE